jgi:hypothetical protein
MVLLKKELKRRDGEKEDVKDSSYGGSGVYRVKPDGGAAPERAPGSSPR